MEENKVYSIKLQEILDDIDRTVPDITKISDKICLLDYDVSTICKLNQTAPMIWIYNNELKKFGDIVCYNYELTEDIEITVMWCDGKKSLLVINQTKLVILDLASYYKIRSVLMVMNFNDDGIDHIKNRICTLDNSLTMNKEINNIYEPLKIIEENGHRKLVVASDLEPWTTNIRISFKDIINLEEVTTIPLDKMNPDMLDIIANRYDWRNDPYIGYNNNVSILAILDESYTATSYIHDPDNILDYDDITSLWVIKKNNNPICCVLLSEYLLTDTLTNFAIFDYDAFNEMYCDLLNGNENFKLPSEDEIYENRENDCVTIVVSNDE